MARFGSSPGDVPTVVSYARRLYRACKAASGEYVEISREVRDLHTVMRHLKYEVEDPGSALNLDSGSGSSLYVKEFAPIVGGCEKTLRQLDELLKKYGRTGGTGKDGRQTGRAWEKLRSGSAEKDELGSIRMELISHKTTLTLYLDKIQLREAGRMSAALEAQTGQLDTKLDTILDKVDTIAAKLSQRAGSQMTTYEDDDKEVWKQFRRELVAEGFSSDVLQQHKDILRAYIRQIDQNGQLYEMPPAKSRPTGVSPQRWLDSIQSPSGHNPPPFDSLNMQTETASVKEMTVFEENMKFPLSTKLERAQPESAPVSPQIGNTTTRREVFGTETPGSPSSRRQSTSVQDMSRIPKPASPVPTVSTMDLIQEIETESPKLPRPDSWGEYSCPPSGPPTLATNPASSNSIPRSMALRPKLQQPPEAVSGEASPQYGTSPSRYGTSPRHGLPTRSIPRNAGEEYSSNASGLAPDSYGREIPLDALWTKIKRSIISPEVLEQDGRRYEARPDFVAVLGVLSREEIEAYAIRTRAIRDARIQRTSPAQPQRPLPRTNHQRYNNPYDDDEEDEYPSDDERGHFRPPEREKSGAYPPTTMMTPPQSCRRPSTGYNYNYDYALPRFPQHPVSDESPPRRRQPSADRYREKDRDKPKRRLRDLTAAGIGGAAMSLLSVLSEAAEAAF